jgi:predicted Zn-dependent protease
VLAEHTRAFATAARYFADNGLARDYWDIQHELDESVPLMLRTKSLSAQQELEADHIGFILGAHAGFVPEAMLSLLQKLRSTQGSLLGTHPSDDERARQARATLETARRLAARARSPR